MCGIPSIENSVVFRGDPESGTVEFDKDALMRMWRLAVISYLRLALKAELINSHLSGKQLERIFSAQFSREWIIYIHKSMPKRHFLEYAARYARRLPIAQRRILEVSERGVVFTTKDKRLSKESGKDVWVETLLPTAKFIAALGRHVLDRYRHGIRYFGLLAPRARNRTLTTVFNVVGQKRSPKPARLSYQESLIRYFKVDPLLDSSGQQMHWYGRLKAVAI